MPGIAADSGAWILQSFELKSVRGKANGPAVFEQELTIGGDEVRHAPPLP